MALAFLAADPAFAQGVLSPGADAVANARLPFIAQLYAERDDLRAETEMLTFLHDAPADDPLRPAVELARAKLYYRVGRYAEADAMLISVLDRRPPRAILVEASHLLGFSWIRQGRLTEALPLLAGEPPLDPLQARAPYDAGRAVAWSTALPGAGFFTLDEPAKGATALGLNLAFLAGAVLSYQQHNVPVALLFAVVEAAFYSGGREAVRDEANRLNGQWLEQQRADWFQRSSESAVVGAAFTVNF
jgi:hypothetical protein